MAQFTSEAMESAPFSCGRRRRDRGPLCRTGNRGDWDRHHRSQQPTLSARAAALGDFCDDVCRNSLIPFKNSLILKIFSLITCVGNCSGSGCSAAVSWYQIGSLSSRIAKFPVKFPDSRELPGGDGFAYDCAHHHPVSANRAFPARRQIGRFCGDFRLVNFRILVSAGVRAFWLRFLALRLRLQKFRSRQP